MENKNASAYSVVYSNTPKSNVQMDFYGSGVSWIGSYSNEQGIANVFIDGKFISEINQFDNTPRFSVPCFKIMALKSGPHSLKIEVADKNKQNNIGQRIVIDAIDIFP
jgi:hypothetical protein